MGGLKSADFESYTKQCVQAFLVARKHAKQVKALIEIMTFHSSYPCFRFAFSFSLGLMAWASDL